MEKFLYADLEHADRIRLLAKTCHARETMTFKRTLTDVDLADRKDLYSREQMRLSTTKVSFTEYKARKSAEIKTIEKNNEDMLEVIANGSVEVFDEVFLIPNHAENVMLFVDKLGEIVHSRELKPEERQGRLMLEDAQPPEETNVEDGEFEYIDYKEGEQENKEPLAADPGDQIINEPVKNTAGKKNRKPKTTKATKNPPGAHSRKAEQEPEQTPSGNEKGLYSEGTDADPEAMARVAEWNTEKE